MLPSRPRRSRSESPTATATSRRESASPDQPMSLTPPHPAGIAGPRSARPRRACPRARRGRCDPRSRRARDRRFDASGRGCASPTRSARRSRRARVPAPRANQRAAGSTDDVTSSISTTSGAVTSVRARHTRCASPPDNARASRSRKVEPNPTRASAAAPASSVSSGSATCRLSRTVPANGVGRWNTIPTRRRSDNGSSPATSSPRNRTTPRSGTSKPVAAPQQRRLARSRGSDEHGDTVVGYHARRAVESRVFDTRDGQVFEREERGRGDVVIFAPASRRLLRSRAPRRLPFPESPTARRSPRRVRRAGCPRSRRDPTCRTPDR